MAGSTMKMVRVCPVFFFLCLLQFCKIGAGQKPIKMECPAVFKDGVVHTINCTIDRTDPFFDGCLTNPVAVGFSFFHPQTATGINQKCSVELKDVGSCNAIVTAGKCGCTKKEGNVETFVYKYIGNKSEDEGSKLLCRLCAPINVDTDVDPDPENCLSLHFFTQPETTTAALTQPETTTAAPGASSGMQGSMLAAVVSVLLTLCIWSLDPLPLSLRSPEEMASSKQKPPPPPVSLPVNNIHGCCPPPPSTFLRSFRSRD